MKKIEHILRRYDTMLKIVLLALWLLWALPLFSPLKEFLAREAESLVSRDTKKIKQESLELLEFAGEEVKRAKVEGISYSPQKYFEDLKEIEEKRDSSETFYPQYEVDQLRGLASDNLKKGYYKWHKWEKACSIYNNWRKENTPEENFFPIEKVSLRGVLSRSTIFYLRSMLLVLFFYLIRMAQRYKSILGTILADKKKFILAILGWFFYIYEYPYNVVREIRVEAELRRLKGLFRVFSAKESKLVREVANSSYYKQWIAEYRQQNRGSFRRGLFLALMATLFLHLLLSSSLRASEKRIRSPGLILCRAENQIETEQNLNDDTSEDTHQVERWGIPPEIGLPEPPLLVMIVRFLKEIWRSRQPDSIDRVPRSSLFGVINVNINQTMKGKRNEYGQKDNLVGCLIN
ncbi:hypothetical protein KJA13_01595 [Patescibacteria group bacterium]|nr:hypothetical protein [Patescibacteria group bacterium]